MLLFFVGLLPSEEWLARPWLLHVLLSFCGASLMSRDQKRARVSLMQAVHCKLESQVAEHLTFLLLGSGPQPLLFSLTFACDPPLATSVRMNQRQHHGTP